MSRPALQSLDIRPMHRTELSALGKHNERIEGKNHSNPTIDPNLTKENYSLIEKGDSTLLERVDQRIKDGRNGDHSKRKIQKNAILLQAVILQVNKEYFDNLGPEKTKEFFQAGYDHICDKFGKENVRYAEVHLDETSPHLHIGFVPLVDGRLVGGEFNKYDTARLHTDMQIALKERGFDIERGKPSEVKKERVSVAQWKVQQLEKQEQEIELKTAKLADVSISLNKVHDIQRDTKIEKPIIGDKYVKIKPSDFDQLTAVAVIGSSMRDENKRLRDDVAQLHDLRKDVRDLTTKNRELTNELQAIKQTLQSPTVQYAIEMDKERLKNAQERAQQAEQAKKLQEQTKKAQEQAKKPEEKIVKQKETQQDLMKNDPYKYVYQKLDRIFKAEGMTDQKEIDIRIAIDMSRNFARNNIEKTIADNSTKAPNESHKALQYAKDITTNMDKKFKNMKKIHEKGAGGGMEIGGGGMKLEKTNPIVDGVMDRFLNPQVVSLRANIFRDDNRKEFMDALESGVDPDFN